MVPMNQMAAPLSDSDLKVRTTLYVFIIDSVSERVKKNLKKKDHGFL